MSNRYRKLGRQCLAVSLCTVLCACASTDPIVNQTETAVGSQRELWSREADSAHLDRLASGSGQVYTMQPVAVQEAPARRGEHTLSNEIPTQIMIEQVPESALGQPLATTQARVSSMKNNRITIASSAGEIHLLARVGGRQLALAEGDAVDVEVRSGTPFQRNDSVQVRGRNDAMGYALVGGDEPVTIELPYFELVATQAGKRDDNSMSVDVRVGAETQRVDEIGSTLRFRSAGLVVQVLASIATEGNAAAVLPESHRLEIAVWRDK